MKKVILILLLIVLGIVCAQAQQDTLRVRMMTYNLRFGELATLEQIAEHIKAFKPDIVTLEEVDVHTGRTAAPRQNGRDFLTVLAERTGMLGLYGKAFDFAGGYFGVGILSRYPYISVEKTMLPNPDKLEPRVLLEATVEMGKDTVVVAATHLSYETANTREAQAQFICSRLRDSKYPVLLGGDFNSTPDSRTIKDIFKKSWTELTNSDLTFPAWKPKIKLDYIMARPMRGWRVVRTQAVQSLLSDHLPVVSELEYVK